MLRLLVALLGNSGTGITTVGEAGQPAPLSASMMCPGLDFTALDSAHASLSSLLEDSGAGNDKIRDAAAVLSVELSTILYQLRGVPEAEPLTEAEMTREVVIADGYAVKPLDQSVDVTAENSSAPPIEDVRTEWSDGLGCTNGAYLESMTEELSTVEIAPCASVTTEGETLVVEPVEPALPEPLVSIAPSVFKPKVSQLRPSTLEQKLSAITRRVTALGDLGVDLPPGLNLTPATVEDADKTLTLLFAAGRPPKSGVAN